MKKSRFTEEQIIFAVRQAGSGTPIAEISRLSKMDLHIQKVADKMDEKWRAGQGYSLSGRLTENRANLNTCCLGHRKASQGRELHVDS